MPMRQAAEEERRERRRFSALPPTQQAALLCQQGGFWLFLAETYGEFSGSPEFAAEAVRRLCGVKSRAEFNKDPQAAKAWRKIVADFAFWSETP